MTGLSNKQIMIVVNRYIGVSDGYLGDFTYPSHAEFYPLYCDLDIDPNELPGTTRERFISILGDASPLEQAKILEGVLERFPLDESNAPESRSESTRTDIEKWIGKLRDGPLIESPSLNMKSEATERALTDAEVLIEQKGATSGVDRVHTALHGYLEALCSDAGLVVAQDAPLTALFKSLRKGHPALSTTGPRANDLGKIMQAFAVILDALNPLRNRASMAHPNRNLLEPPEAMLVIHSVRTLFHYLNARLRGSGEDPGSTERGA